MPYFIALTITISAFVAGISLTLFWSRQKGFFAPAIFAAVVYICLAVVYKIFVGGLQGDESTYHQQALNFLQQFQTGVDVTPVLPSSKSAYSYTLAFFYFFAVPEPLLGVILLTPLFIAIVPMMGIATRNFYESRDAAVAASWVATLFPQLIFWSPWLRREIVLFFTIALGILAASQIWRRSISRGTIFGSASISLAIIFRHEVSWSIILLLTSTLICSYFYSRATEIARKQTIFSGILVLTVFVLGTALISNIATIPISKDSPLTSQENRERLLSSNADPDQNLSVQGSNPSNTDFVPRNNDPAIPVASDPVVVTLSNLAPSLFGPYPWQWKNSAWIIAGIDGLVTLFIFLLVLGTLVVSRFPRVPTLLLALSASPLILANALVLANFGIAMRVRAHILLFLIPPLAIALTLILDMRRSKSTKPKEI